MPKPVTELPETQVMPAEKLEKRTRRKFSPEYKLRILREADACARGELGALLRREKLYSNQSQQWRREFAEGGVEGLAKSTPGPTSSMSADQKRIARLEKEVEIVFVADNPGDWMFHCQVLEHQASGMSAVVRVT